MAVNYTPEQLAQIKAARARGAVRLRMGNEEVQYRSLAEMDQIIASIEAELTGTSGRGKQHYPQFMERPS